MRDHIDGNRGNNHPSNIRFVTRSQNGMNRKLSSNNVSGKSGVWWNKNRWEVVIVFDNQRIYIGRFKNFDDAVDARIKYEEKYYGEYSLRSSRKSKKDLFS